ncbi:MAG: hypothetical protein LBJ00_00550 [Planctomycetaceae bacterium]|nr:hypothetical protein [Planctomycetaceae bacterium]
MQRNEFVLFAADSPVAQPDLKNTTPNIPENTESQTNDEKSISNPFFSQLATPDRLFSHRLEQIEQLLKIDRHTEAVDVISSLLEESDNFLIPPLNNDENITTTTAIGQTTDMSITKYLIGIFQKIPDKSKKQYYTQHSPQAALLLETAVKQGSFEMLQKISKKYLLTESGITALFFIGIFQFESGDWETALLTFRKINYVADCTNIKLNSLEPLLSLSTATCQIKLNLENDAQKTLENFIKNFPQPRLILNGKLTPNLKTADEIFSLIKESINQDDPKTLTNWLEQNGWLLHCGIPSQNPNTTTTAPFAETWKEYNFHHNKSETLIKKLHLNVQSSNETYIPALQPLVIDNLVIIRGIDETTAINIETGKRVWYQHDCPYNIPLSLAVSLKNSGLTNSHTKPNTLGSTRLGIWHDRVSSIMSSDGKYLFTIEGHLHQDTKKIQPLKISNQTLNNPFSKTSNTLAAKDIKTGDIIWQIGKFNYVQKILTKYDAALPPEIKKQLEQNITTKPNTTHAEKNKLDVINIEKDDESLFSQEELLLSDTQFLGAPLPFHGKLYSVAEIGNTLYLLVLNAENGKLISKVPLVQIIRHNEHNYLRYFYGLTPSASSGIIFCPTGLGMVVALDATTMSPLWCFSYTPSNPPTTTDTTPIKAATIKQRASILNPVDSNNDYFRNAFIESGWQVPSIMVAENRILIAPPDVPFLYCLDSLTGKLLWQTSNFNRSNALYVACIHDNIAYIVTPNSMLMLSMDSGQPIQKQILTDNNLPLASDTTDTNQSTQNTTDHISKLVFPVSFKPTGLGIHSGNLYYIPLSRGYVGVVNLSDSSMKLISSPESALNTEKQQDNTKNNPQQNDTIEQIRDISFGNLVGIHGRFFSQSPLELVCFDQYHNFNERTKQLLENNPEDPIGLLQLAYIRRAENNFAEAIRLFRRSIEIRPTEIAVYNLRQTLIEAVRNNYKTWKQVLAETMSMPITLEEYVDILFAQVNGATDNGDIDDCISMLHEVFKFESDFHVNTVIGDRLTSQLHNAVGTLIKQIKQNNQPHSIKKISLAADKIFNNFCNNNFNFASTKTTITQPTTSEYKTNTISQEIRYWQIFIELFYALPIVEDAKKILSELYIKNQHYLAAELLMDTPFNEINDVAENKDKNTAETKTNLPKIDELKFWAEELTLRGVIPDAYYYYSLIAEFYEKNGKKITEEVLDLPAFKNYIQQHKLPVDFPKGEITCYVKNTDSKLQQLQNTTVAITPNPSSPKNLQANLLLQTVRSDNTNFGIDAIPVQYLGSEEPFLSPYKYALELHDNTPSLAAYGNTNKEHWRCSLAEYFSDLPTSETNDLFVQRTSYARYKASTIFLKGCGHLLLLMYADRIIAIDTFGCGGESNNNCPRILWSRKTSPDHKFSEQRLSNEHTIKLIFAGSYGRITPTPHYYKSMVFISKKIVCYRENNTLYGLNPLTGNVVWTRDIMTDECSLIGVRNSLFLFYNDTLQIVAVEPINGRTIKTGYVAGNILASYGTSVVVDRSNKQDNRSEILVTDLRDIFLDDNEIKVCDNINEIAQNELFKVDANMIPVRNIFPKTNDTFKMIKALKNDRYIAFVVANTAKLSITNTEAQQRMYIYDLKNKSHSIGKTNNDGNCEGADISKAFNIDGTMVDFQIYQNGNQFIMLLIASTNSVNKRGTISTENNGTKSDQKDLPLISGHVKESPLIGGFVVANTGYEFFMSFDANGNQCWENSMNVREWYLLQDSMSENIPVFIYAGIVTSLNGKRQTYIGINVIDKTTGKIISRKLVPCNKIDSTQFIRLATDSKEHEIKLFHTNQVVTIKFENER